MENINYTKFSEEEKKVETPVVEEPVIKEEVVTPYVEEIEEEEVIDEPEEFVGVVANCSRLNVRKEPKSDAAVLKIIDAGTEVAVIDEPTDDFYKVQVAGYTGFCMKEFITIE